MANVNPPKKNQAWAIDVSLEDFSTPGAFKSTPTLAAGDFKLVIDGAASTLGAASSDSLITLPTNTPASSIVVHVALSATEMNGDIITVKCSDQTSPKEWADLLICVQTTA